MPRNNSDSRCSDAGPLQNRERRHTIDINRTRVTGTILEGTMRVALIVLFVVSIAACGGNTTAPSATSVGTPVNIADRWNGTIASSNNASAHVGLILTQSGSDVTGTWTSTSVAW